jgi:hypothetical protein
MITFRGTAELFRGHFILASAHHERKYGLKSRILVASALMKQAPEGLSMGMQQIRHKGAAAAAMLGLGAILTGCSREVAGTQLASAVQGAPVAVSCEPNQRAVVRQVAVNGTMQSQVNCESAFAPAGTTGSFGGMTPVSYAPASSGFQQVGYVPAGYTPIAANEPALIVRTSYPQQVVRRPVSYQQSERLHQPKRSVKKSVAIIGASAGVGAGVGAAVGGKKGAGIGALIGGGGAALWDQITRR